MLSAAPSTMPYTQASSWDTISSQTGDQGYVSPLIDLYLKWDADLGDLYEDSPADREPVSYNDVLDAPSGSEADPAKSKSIHSKDKSYRQTVCVVRSYMKLSFIQKLEYICPSCQDNPWTGRSHPTGKVSISMPADDWFCTKIEQMNLHLLQGHVTRPGDRNWLQFNHFIKPPKPQMK